MKEDYCSHNYYSNFSFFYVIDILWCFLWIFRTYLSYIFFFSLDPFYTSSTLFSVLVTSLLLFLHHFISCPFVLLLSLLSSLNDYTHILFLFLFTLPFSRPVFVFIFNFISISARPIPKKGWTSSTFYDWVEAKIGRREKKKKRRKFQQSKAEIKLVTRTTSIILFLCFYALISSFFSSFILFYFIHFSTHLFLISLVCFLPFLCFFLFYFSMSKISFYVSSV